MDLVFEFKLLAHLNAFDVGSGPFGTRTIYEVTGGKVEGDRISGEVLGGGADWLLIGPDGYARLDVRIQIRTTDGAYLYVQYPGVLELNDKVGHAMATTSGTEFSDQYFRTTPRIESGENHYDWVNKFLFLAEGRLIPNGVEYYVFRVT